MFVSVGEEDEKRKKAKLPWLGGLSNLQLVFLEETKRTGGNPAHGHAGSNRTVPGV